MTPQQQFIYTAFRWHLWSENYGTYDDIDRDWNDGKLDERFQEWISPLAMSTEAMRHSRRRR